MIFTRFYTFKTAFFMLILASLSTRVSHAEIVVPGPWNEAALVQLVSSVQPIDKPGDVIVALSDHFKDSPYAENTLHGGPDEPEELVINLSAFDCFTFLDVVEALRRTSRYEDFSDNLKAVRYLDATVAYEKRRHFFSDWLVGDVPIKDVTVRIGKGRTLTVNKHLNLKSDASLWLAGIGVSARSVHYLPTRSVDEKILSALRPGDYVGVFSPLDGLDVSHTGIIVKDKGQTLLRHASSRSETGRVVDEALLPYLKGKPGLVVYRVKP